MRTLKLIIELELDNKHDEALEIAFRSPTDAFNLYQNYKRFCDELDYILNVNFIL